MKIKIREFLLLLLAIALFSFTNDSYAQEEPPTIFVSVDFMKSVPGEDYVKMENEIWKPMHQKRVANGKLASWNLYRVVYPFGTSVEYDYITVNVYTDWDHIDSPFEGQMDKLFKSVHPSADMEKMMDWTERSRSLVKSELFVLVGEAVPGPPGPGNEYLFVNQMRTAPGKAQDYVKKEMKYYQPYHAARAAAGHMIDWGLYQKIFPGGTEQDYNYVTVDVWGKWSDIGGGGDAADAIWEKVHPGTAQDDVYPEMAKLRDLIQQEVWQRISHTSPVELTKNK